MHIPPFSGISGRNERTEQVFYDPTLRRLHLVRRLLGAVLVVLAAWVTCFAAGLAFMANLPLPDRPTDATLAQDSLTRYGLIRDHLTPPLAAGCPPRGAGPDKAFAFVGVGPDGNELAVAAACPFVDALLADWAVADVATGRVTTFAASSRMEAVMVNVVQAAAPGRPIDLVLTLTLPRPLSAQARRLEQAPARAALVGAMIAYRAMTGVRGLCLRPYSVASNQKAGLALLLRDLKSALGRDPLCLVLENDTDLWRDPTLTTFPDRVVIEMFRRIRPGMGPTDLAPPKEVDRVLEEAGRSLAPEKLVFAFGSHAAHWIDGAVVDAEMPFAEAMRLIARHDADLRFDPALGGSGARFTDAAGHRHEIAVLDVAALVNQRAAIADRGLSPALALVSAGTEDPAAWHAAFGAVDAALSDAATVALDRYVGVDGTGPLLRVSEPAETGERTFDRDARTGRVTAVHWTLLPRPFTLERWGLRPERTVSLTFDDGPDPLYTPQILDVLAQKGVTATFFVTGRNGAGQTELLRRIVAEGHLIGSHTYSHLDTATAPDWRFYLEINAIQRLVAGATGRGTTLYRSPYERSEGPVDAAGAVRLGLVQAAGYTIVGADISPRDWETRRPETILSEIDAGLDQDGKGMVIALHDAGGDRQATVDAIGPLIDHLRARGIAFVPLTDIAHATRDRLMPPSPDWLSRIDWLTLSLLQSGGTVLGYGFWGVLVVAAARSLSMLVLAHVRRRHSAPASTKARAVTVAIAAYNEAPRIGACLKSVLALDWPELRVLVIDDGSTDRTAAEVRAIADPRVVLLHRENGGKARALADAFRQARTDLVLAIDADTAIAPDALRLMVPHLDDPAVAAVAGRVLVGNEAHFLTGLQALEYATAQAIDRRAAEVMGTMIVVPGAIGLWRRDAVLGVGGPSAETLAEDADLTVSLLRAGHRICFEDRALTRTAVPQHLSGLMRQRVRWSFGMMQTAWKHRRAYRKARWLGLVGLPDLWVFGVGLGLVAPLVDLGFVVVLVRAALAYAEGASPFADAGQTRMLAAYLVLPAIDVLTLALALRFDRDTPRRLLVLVLFQRLVYRPILYIALWRAVWRVVTGLHTPWSAARSAPRDDTPRAYQPRDASAKGPATLDRGDLARDDRQVARRVLHDGL